MQAELKSFFSNDLDKPDLPEDVYNCEVWINATIGVLNEDGGDNFQFGFITPQSLQIQINECKKLWPKGHLIIQKFSWELVEDSLNTLCRFTNGKNWEEISIKLSRYGAWEFEDYHESPAL